MSELLWKACAAKTIADESERAAAQAAEHAKALKLRDIAKRQAKAVLEIGYIGDTTVENGAAYFTHDGFKFRAYEAVHFTSAFAHGNRERYPVLQVKLRIIGRTWLTRPWRRESRYGWYTVASLAHLGQMLETRGLC